MYSAGVLDRLEAYLADPHLTEQALHVHVSALLPRHDRAAGRGRHGRTAPARSGHRLTVALIEKITNLAELKLIREVVLVSDPDSVSADEAAG